MAFTTPDLCDEYPESVSVLDPIFNSYGGRESFCGEVATIKCFEDNSKVKELVEQDGKGRVMVVDAGGSLRRACLGDMLAEKAMNNGWEGIIMYGCIRDAEIIRELDLGVKALNTHPMKTEKRGHGDVDVNVSFAGVTICPGDSLYADVNGIIIAQQPLLV